MQYFLPSARFNVFCILVIKSGTRSEGGCCLLDSAVSLITAIKTLKCGKRTEKEKACLLAKAVECFSEACCAASATDCLCDFGQVT